MSEKQSDIAERLRVMADDLVLYKEIDTGADDMREAADEIESLRSQIATAVAAERASILAMIQALASAEERSPDLIQMLSGLATAIQARAEDRSPT